ncbi:hypothetical protein MSG28_012068 [Choristoneura fumiferana]|uniref:Uncharacterized protein n=1 Tax=Choristoneura fumiferana TaxID=7141 RepID=A0ACC0KNH2_CHOFU|nr:hypothetical protein MSG28_012068 [Choristoneura fumiferana]
MISTKADVNMYCFHATLCLLMISCYAQEEVVNQNQANASPNPRVNIDMSQVLSSLVSKLYSNLPSVNAPEESQVQERSPRNSLLQEMKAGRHGSGPFHIYGRHIERVAGHKLSGAGRNKDHRNIIDVL